MEQQQQQAAQRAYARFARWMRDEALPFWSTTGLAADGGVVERMTLAGVPDRPGFKRVRVHARQLYVFAHAHLLGIPGMLPAGEAAFAFLSAHGQGGDGRWVVKMGEAGGVVDAECDLYDQAFVILALAWWGKASGDAVAVSLARETLAMIGRDFARPDGRGFLSRLPDAGRALQNPHMHLFEAVLALHKIAPNAQSHAACVQLRAHFDACLFDEPSATVGEYFTMDWQPEPGVAGQTVEPGHLYEWAWLLDMAERQGFGVGEPAAGRMFAFAERHSLAADTAGNSLIFDAVDRHGGLLDGAHRSWPQTERIKALVVRGERSGAPDYAAIAACLNALWQHYLAPAPHGCWIDHIGADLQPRTQSVPASTLYHLFLAYAELGRCAPSLFGPELKMAENI